MKSLVIYYSKTGNTEKVAKAIARGLGADLGKINEINDISEYDLICVGTPVHSFIPAEPVNKFLKKLPDLSGKQGAGFCTMHMVGDKRTLKILKKEMEARGIKFLGNFSCKGLSRIVGDFGPRIFNKGRPNRRELEKAEDFGRELLIKTK